MPCTEMKMLRFSCLLFVLLARQSVHALLSEAKLSMFITALQADSLIFPASDMGVQHIEFSNLTVANPTYPYNPKAFSVRLHLFLKYTHWKGQATIKGFAVAETRDAAKAADGVQLSPVLTLQPLNSSFGTREITSFQVSCQVHSYWDPPKQAAMVYPFEHAFWIPADSNHDYLMGISLDKQQTYSWTPSRELNMVNGQGVAIPPIAAQSPPTQKEVIVVLKPLYNFSPTVYSALILNHIQYYQTLNVSKHIIYLRRETIPALVLGNTKISKLAQEGKLMVVEWNGLPEHDVWHRSYDLRAIYSHAMLAFTGMDVYLLNIDLDEYMITQKTELMDKSIQEMLKECAGDAIDIKVQRLHAACKHCERDKPEIALWTDYYLTSHPLTWYHLINKKDTTKRRSFINPNYMKAYYVHFGSPQPDKPLAAPDAECLTLLHIPNMIRVREEADSIEQDFTEDTLWMDMLPRFHPIAEDPKEETAAAPSNDNNNNNNGNAGEGGNAAKSGNAEGDNNAAAEQRKKKKKKKRQNTAQRQRALLQSVSQRAAAVVQQRRLLQVESRR